MSTTERLWRQAQIEKAVGIDEEIAQHMMKQETEAARTAMGLLAIQVNGYDPGGFALLKCAVVECRREIAAAKPALPTRVGPPPRFSRPDP